ncbi:NUC189-domain-containing protein [Trametes coccinea BRFM310]|uniref:NUC189-domain-containing protein n=1 Tax=Trametes coccinea (strain BRFM310) TaxID=1353009 RepID=A0A1Y2IYQ0_TRAC3|nr:NUC189-domain-containing protein [Trametes coccinea BRFM310]
MAPSPQKSKKSRTKPPRDRPQATSAISQPAVEDATTSTYLSSFSPDGQLFAFLSLAIDKHALKVYDTATRRSVAEHVVDAARVTSLCWARLDLAEGQAKGAEDEDASRKSKRKKRNSLAADATTPSTNAPQLVVLGLSDGSLLLFSPSHGRLLRTLSDPSSSSAVLAVAGQEDSEDPHTLWTSSSDGALRLWNARTNQVSQSHFSDDRIPFTALSVRKSDEEGVTEVLAAHHSIQLLALSADAQKPKTLAKFTGHASPVSALHWVDRSRFLSYASADRFINVWEVPVAPKTEGKTIATIPLDSDARAITLSAPASADSSSQHLLFALSASGKVSLFTLTADLATSSPAKGKAAIPTLNPKSVISPTSSKKAAGSLTVLAVSSVDDTAGRLRIASVTGGVQLAFDAVDYRDQSGHFVPEVSVTVATPNAAVGQAAGQEAAGAPNKRYNEAANLAVGTGAEVGQDRELDDLVMRDVDGALDADLAELSLGQRLTAVQGGDAQASVSESESEADEAAAPNGKPRKGAPVDAVPASSLTRTLIQALHSSDTRLLETCLAHSDPTLIRNTVRRLPPQLAVPLVAACVERLNRGARGNNLKGGGGGASSQRGTALINWVKAVLTTHSGHLMTMPDLVARLSGLHATLTQRLTLQESLLSLSGRLDMVISQIEMRSSGPPAPLPMPKNKRSRNKQAKAREARRYVEGESEDEDEEQMDVEVESADEEGSVEDVELGGEDEDSEGESIDETDEDEDDEDDEEDDGDDPTLGGFIDDEAEEYSEDEDEDEESE